MSDHKLETLSGVSVTSEEVARQIKVVTDPLSQQTAHCEGIQELRNEQGNRRHEEVPPPQELPAHLQLFPTCLKPVPSVLLLLKDFILERQESINI